MLRACYESKRLDGSVCFKQTRVFSFQTTIIWDAHTGEAKQQFPFHSGEPGVHGVQVLVFPLGFPSWGTGIYLYIFVGPLVHFETVSPNQLQSKDPTDHLYPVRKLMGMVLFRIDLAPKIHSAQCFTELLFKGTTENFEQVKCDSNADALLCKNVQFNCSIKY